MATLLSYQKKPDWALGEKEGKSKSVSEGAPEVRIQYNKR